MNTNTKLWKALTIICFTLALTIYFASCAKNNKKECSLCEDWQNFANRKVENKIASHSQKDDTEVPKPAVEDGNCFKAFLDTLVKHGFSASNKPRITESIIFGSAELLEWLNKYEVFKNSARIDIKLGIYTSAYISSLPEPYKTNYAKNEGRIGIFIWPAKVDGSNATTPQGVVIPAYDLGGLQP